MVKINSSNETYNSKLIINLLKRYGLFSNNNIYLLDIRILICRIIKCKEYNDLKNILELLFEYNNDDILKLLFYYKNKIIISENDLKNIISQKDKINLYINFIIENIHYKNYIVEFCYDTTGTVTPLHVATRHNARNIIDLLMSYGADINIVNNKGETAFFFNCKYYSSLLGIDSLLKYNINIFIKNNENESLVFSFIRYIGSKFEFQYISMLEYLFKLGFDVNETDKDGRTPLMEASYCGNINVMEVCLKHGANLYRKDNKGNTALSLAQTLTNKRVENYLIEHGATWKF
ncbi:ankyrin [Piromyces finnis]|uniref:Ankyrin n=1 Tax=Piromyces finnis TaxID=1754191 RepID=A0A1Y1UTQ4_9FUNG|nr:ankyrin [Piromyces finnis]|eukprot:ORX41398.1 ankyrin [Piromyces finnis]